MTASERLAELAMKKPYTKAAAARRQPLTVVTAGKPVSGIATPV